ncbi:MAG: hypothetical protein ACOYEQ_10340 [Bacillota bacterium]|jgi:hypothetical protein
MALEKARLSECREIVQKLEPFFAERPDNSLFQGHLDDFREFAGYIARFLGT